ncbi:MAG: hypothetical protein U0441_13375 [Polyangiaceae bacterium]
MAENDASRTLLLGVSLAQYAGIQTAVSLGFPLDQALANERLSAKKWERCRAAWAGRLAREGHGGALSSALRDKQVEAAKWLGRRIAPLEDDLTAWMGFLGAYAAEPAPSALLNRLGLRDDDVKRLVLAWKRRMDEDEALAKRATELAKKAPRAVPSVQISPGKLRPYPWSPGPESRPQATLPSKPEESAPDTPVEADVSAPPVVVETPSFLLRSVVSSVPSAASSPLAEPPSRGTPIGETVMDLRLPDGAKVLPFGPAEDKASPALFADSRSPPPRSGETALVLELPRRLLPFESESQRVSAESPGETTTLPVLELPVRRDVPFEAARWTADRRSSPAGEPGATSSAGRSAPISTGTVLALDVPSGPSVPFKGPVEGAASAREYMAGDDLAALVRAVRARGPAAVSDDRRDSPMESQIRSSAPAEGSASLTLEQHASLCAELAFSPERASEVLARYGVTSETKRGLDELYLGAPGQKGAWEAAYRAYYAWLVDASRKKR